MNRDQFKAWVPELEAPEDVWTRLINLFPFIGVAFCLIKLALM